MLKQLNKYLKDGFISHDYLFHGSPLLLNEVSPMQSQDSNNNSANVDQAIFLSNSLLVASAYAFKDQIKAASIGLKWNFNISSLDSETTIVMDHVNIPEILIGYIYIFKNDLKFKNEPLGSLQYKSYDPLIPLEIIPIAFEDFKKYYQINTSYHRTK